MLNRTLFIGLMMVLFSACASFYEVSYDFNREFEKGNIDHALEELRSDKQYAKSKAKFLYYTNVGLLLSMKGEYEESTTYFEKA